MHMCPHPVPLGIVVYSNALLHVSLFVVDRFEVIFTLCTGRTFTHATEGLWKTRALGGRDAGIPPFKMPTLNKGTLWAAESMRDRYHPKMLLYGLDELFFIYAQIKDSPLDERVMLAYEILCISSNRCTDRRNGVEQMGVPDTLALLNTKDAQHLECLAWPGPFTMVPCWWARCPNVAPCWQGCSDTSTGATKMWPIACQTLETRLLGS